MGRERRVKLFGVLVALALFAIAGALVYGAVSTDSPSVNHEITVANHGNDSHRVNVTLRSGSETVFTGSDIVGSDGEWNVTTVDGPGEYTLTAETRAGRTQENYTLPLADGDLTSFTSVSIRDDGTPEIEVYAQVGG